MPRFDPRVIVILWLAAGVGGCTVGTTTGSEFEQEFGVSVASVPVIGEDPFAPGGVDQLFNRLREALGVPDPTVGEVRLNPYGMTVVAQNPANPSNQQWYFVHSRGVDVPRSEPRAVETAPLSKVAVALTGLPEVIAGVVAGSEYTVNHVTAVNVELRGTAPPILQISLSDIRTNSYKRIAAEVPSRK